MNWNRTIDIEVNADLTTTPGEESDPYDLTTLYPTEVCRQIGNRGASAVTVYYTEKDDATTIKSIRINAGENTGILPVIKEINTHDTDADCSLKLYMQKV